MSMGAFWWLDTILDPPPPTEEQKRRQRRENIRDGIGCALVVMVFILSILFVGVLIGKFFL